MTDPTSTQPHTDPVQPAGSNGQVPPPDIRGKSPDGDHWHGYPGYNPSRPGRTIERPAASPDYSGQRRPARDRVRRRRIRRELGAPDDWAWVIIAAALLGVTVVMSMSIFFLIQATRTGDRTVATSAAPPEPTSVLFGPGGIMEMDGGTPVGGMLGDGQSMVIVPWDGEERFTVLVMGMDRRPSEMGQSFRTDTMILVSLDPATKHVGMLGIPRDLFVDIPGFAPNRINTAYSDGELEGPGGGPRLAMQTVQYNLGIPVNEFLVVDFNAFIGLIDEIGGIDVYVETPIYDPEYPDMNYGYDPFSITAGWHHLDGETALKYARSRHSSDDIDRQRRQQDVIYAIRDRVINLNMIPELAIKAPTLWSQFNEGVDTGLSLDQMLQLAWYLKDIPSENFTRGVLGWEYVVSWDYNGQAVLVPNREKIGGLMVEVFGADYNRTN
ncbi:MAG TPA: LCP family protein [Aggregatilinea sp.]|jgi:LCP family protein required for cell wall assembly|uniref:LCP family protein n=1 Tax=Aggregatilinea sp. TaxID=2806333 RepID=UPI002CB5E419|nr:LCP family protein [Aggregatilinea sp.]HML22207.1 LCP family protein [Aggregatilinea sp.]